MPRCQEKIPEWLMVKESEPAGTCVKPKRDGNYIHRTLKALAGFMQQDLLVERYAAINGMLQSVDPRVKLISLLILMIIAGAAQRTATLLLLSVTACILAYMSRLNMGSFLKRVWLIIPLMVLIFSVPAATNLFIPGHPALFIYRGVNAGIGFVKLPQEMYFSSEGIGSAFRLVIRIGTSISLAYLLIMTTRWSHVTRSLRILGIPQFVTALLDMTYRYIFVFVNTAISMFEARQARTVGRSGGRKLVSSGIGMLFLKSGQMGEQVYDAMLCRCFTGEPVSLARFRFTAADAVWLAAIVIIIFTISVF